MKDVYNMDHLSPQDNLNTILDISEDMQLAGQDAHVIESINNDELSRILASGHTGGVLEFVDMVNPVTGNNLLRKNAIVQRGRTFALEKIHNILAPVETGYIRDLNRSILLFGVGTGGTPVDQPFAPIPVANDSTSLTTPVPFRVVDPNNATTAIAESEISSYPIFTGLNGKRNYYYKTFDQAQTQFVVNKADNKIYRKIPLYISPNDCRGLKINEIALFFCTAIYGNIEMYSKATFDTESMSTNTGKGLLINYYTYA
jgi:hypothetical protein